MIYLEKRLGCPGAAVLYGFFCIPAAFGMGSMVQANAISETVSYVYGIPEAAVGVILVILAGIVLAGGGRRIFLAAERLVPLSAGLYTAAALAVIILYAGNVPGVILLYADSACDPLRGGQRDGLRVRGGERSIAHKPLFFYSAWEPRRVCGGGLRGAVRVLHDHRLVLYGAAGGGVSWREDLGKDPGSLCGGISSGGVPRVPRGDGDGVGGLGHL